VLVRLQETSLMIMLHKYWLTLLSRDTVLLADSRCSNAYRAFCHTCSLADFFGAIFWSVRRV